MTDHYETRFGIYNHLKGNKDRPLASVAMFPSENFTERSALYDAYSDFAMKNLKDIWGLSVKEYLDQPHYVVRMLRDITEEVLKHRQAAVESIDPSKK